MDIYAFISRFLGIYTVILMVFGSAGNLLSMFICMRKKLRAIPTFVFVIYMLFCDTLSLYFWNLDQFFNEFYGYEYVMELASIHACRVVTFLQLFSLTIKVCLLAHMTILIPI